ncbi:MAG: leucine-rich repeat domain-containing protein [Bacteroidales bacterium]|nr:leucine-rich repeat domain-containing protein [Bacteroidales bacterium]
MRKIGLIMALLAALLVGMGTARAEFLFSRVSPSGHTLYYNFVTGGVQVSYPNSDYNMPYNGYEKPLGDLVIPDSIEHTGTVYAVRSINAHTFKGCDGLRSVRLPRCLTAIGSEAFSNCSMLTTLEVPQGVTAIGADAFFRVNNVSYVGDASGRPWGAKNLNGYVHNGFVFADESRRTITGYVGSEVDIVIPSSVETIAAAAFYNNLEVRSFLFPPSLTEVDDEAFAYCSALRRAYLPDAVVRLGGYAFHHCSMLGEVRLGPNIEEIGYLAFGYCDSLVSVVLPPRLSLLQRATFYSCSSLEEVTFGRSLDSVADLAFALCTNLTQINAVATHPAHFASGALQGTPGYKTLRVPCGQLLTYTAEWGSLGEVLEYGSLFTLSALSSDNRMGEVSVATDHGFSARCDSIATIVAHPADGYHFVTWSNGMTDNPHMLYLSGDSMLTAYFAAADLATTRPQLEPDAEVYVSNGRIVAIGGANGSRATVCDIVGRRVATLELGGRAESSILPRGIYVVVLPSGTARKVAVM